MYKYVIISIFLTFVLSSCDKTEVIVEGMAPVYLDPLDFSLIKSVNPQPFADLGKIVVDGNYMFINEKLKGIHVVDNSDPSNPVNIRFFQIPGNTVFTIKNHILYADNSIHLLVIDISNIYKIKVLNYVENLYLNSDLKDYYPPNFHGYFECVDKTKGIFIYWEKKQLRNPLCYTN